MKNLDERRRGAKTVKSTVKPFDAGPEPNDKGPKTDPENFFVQQLLNGKYKDYPEHYNKNDLIELNKNVIKKFGTGLLGPQQTALRNWAGLDLHRKANENASGLTEELEKQSKMHEEKVKDLNQKLQDEIEDNIRLIGEKEELNKKINKSNITGNEREYVKEYMRETDISLDMKDKEISRLNEQISRLNEQISNLNTQNYQFNGDATQKYVQSYNKEEIQRLQKYVKGLKGDMNDARINFRRSAFLIAAMPVFLLCSIFIVAYDTNPPVSLLHFDFVYVVMTGFTLLLIALTYGISQRNPVTNRNSAIACGGIAVGYVVILYYFGVFPLITLEYVSYVLPWQYFLWLLFATPRLIKVFAQDITHSLSHVENLDEYPR